MLPERIEELIEPVPNSGCWIWLGAVSGGYGRCGIRPAHRVVYETLRGQIPAGLTLDHKCRVRCCVNPDHLEPVTDRENVARGISFSAINARKTHCPNGHELSGTNLYRFRNGWRGCRTCRRDWKRRSRAAKANA